MSRRSPSLLICLQLAVALSLTACGDKAGDDSAASDPGDGAGSGIDGGSDADDGADTDDEPDTDGGSGATGVPADALVAEAAAAWCGAVLGCCDGEDQSWAFSGWSYDDRVAHLHDRMPPTATLDAESCVALVSDILPELWMGQWLSAHEAGHVGYDGAAAEACLEELSTATCGAPVRDALLDSTCFANAAPAGGEQQRRIFERDATSGDCVPIADGFGGLYYGSCDPTQAFCCLETSDGCNPFPVPGEIGSCTPAGQAGETCSDTWPIQLCATGLDCLDGRCEALSSDALDLGEACYDSSTYSLLGHCSTGWCDLFGSGVCEAPKPEGESCWGDEECATSHCDAVSLTCAVNDICDG
jgi:hypothetical protein